MPGFDQTGPMGDGSMTGGGFGMCGKANDVRDRRRRRANGVGRGRGRCFNRGQGRMVDLPPVNKDLNNSQAYRDINFTDNTGLGLNTDTDTNLILNTLIQKIDALEKKIA